MVKIYFVDPAEKSVELLHFLKLYPDQGAGPSQKKPVVSEKYDEIVFFEPTENFAYILEKGPVKSIELAGDEEQKENKVINEPMQDVQANNMLSKDNEESLPKEGGVVKIETEESKAAQKEKLDDRNKPIDRRQYAQFYTQFPNDEKDLEALQDALEFIRNQVQAAREELIEIDKKAS